MSYLWIFCFKDIFFITLNPVDKVVFVDEACIITVVCLNYYRLVQYE